MGKARTDKLFVNLSASQARKRLKGHGLGVRKIETAGRNQAVIHHTATGRHLHDLAALLDDVTTSASQSALGTPIANLRNLGPSSATRLARIGVHSRADLERLGPALAYRLVKQLEPDVSLNLLWAMAAALSDRDWRELSDLEKKRLRRDAEEC